MNNKVNYEWCYETVDENGDIVDNDFADKLSDFTESNKTDTLVLVRDEGNEHDGLQDRCWAYVKDGKLPEKFSDSIGNEININVPKKFHKELSKHLK